MARKGPLPKQRTVKNVRDRLKGTAKDMFGKAARWSMRKGLKFGPVFGLGLFLGIQDENWPQWRSNLWDVAKASVTSESMIGTWRNATWFGPSTSTRILTSSEAAIPGIFPEVSEKLQNRGIRNIPTTVERAITLATQGNEQLYNLMLLLFARESGFNSIARNGDSTAQGLGQFIDQTFLLMAYHHRDEMPSDIVRRFHLDKVTTAIRNSTTYYEVPAEYSRRVLNDARNDPFISAFLATHYMAENLETLKEDRPNRQITFADAYLAYFLGAKEAVRFIRLSEGQNTKNHRASDYFKGAANSNRNVFYSGNRAKSLTEIYRSIANSMTTLPIHVPENLHRDMASNSRSFTSIAPG